METTNNFRKKGRRLPTVLSVEEFNQLLKHTTNKYHRLAFKLGFLCGLRISEITNLKKEEIDLGRWLLFVHGKGNKDRYVPIPSVLRRDLNNIPIKVGVRALQIAFKKAAVKAGITKDVHFHTLRHSAATYLIQKGLSTREVQQFLGHSKITTTEIYTHVSPESLRNKIEEVWK